MIVDRGFSKLYIKGRNIGRDIFGRRYSFVTIEKLVMWTSEWVKSFPDTYDVIVGIPRSGLLVASTIALKLGKALTTPELFIQNQYWKTDLINEKEGGRQKVLLIDDSINSGTSMEKNTQLLSHSKNIDITTAALIATPHSKMLVDMYYKVVPSPRIFEWNLLHAKRGVVFASDMDGVICENCPHGIGSEERKFTTWIKNAKPYLIPRFEIDVILSNRLEKDRYETEKWLAEHKVKYKELILWDIQSRKERKGKHAQRKIDVLLGIKPDIFWESSLPEAKEIWKATKIPTLCIDEMVMFD